MEEIKVNYTPAKFEIIDREGVEQAIKAVAAKYANYLPTAETLTADRKTLAELRKVKESLETERKKQKATIMTPYKELETWLKGAAGPLDAAINGLKNGIDAIEETERENRQLIIMEIIELKSQENELDARLFTEYAREWSAKKGNFTATGNASKNLLDSINFVLEQELRRQQEAAEARKQIAAAAFDNNISDTPYINMLANGRSVGDVLTVMLEEVAKREAEAKRIAEEATERATQQLAQDFGYNDTPREQNAPQAKTKPKEEAQLYEYRLNIDMIFYSTEEKDRFKETMDAAGFAYSHNSFKRFKKQD